MTLTFMQIKGLMRAVGDEDWATVSPEDSDIYVRFGGDGDIMFSDAGAGEYETFDMLDEVLHLIPQKV